MAWQMILRAIGGGMQGAANGMQKQMDRPAPGENHSANRLDDRSVQEEIGQNLKDIGEGGGEALTSARKKSGSSGGDAGSAGTSGANAYMGAAQSGEFAGTGIQQMLGKGGGASAVGGMKMGGAGGMKMCDEETKAYFEKRGVADDYEKICSYVFKYKPAVQERFAGYNGVDGDTHVGIMAQELAALPSTSATVSKDANSGYLQVDTQELTMSNTAAIGELARRVADLERLIGSR